MPERRAGVVLVTRNFPPLRGGMERLNQRMLAGLAENGPVGLVGPMGCAGFAPENVPVREAPAAVGGFLPRALAGAIRMAARLRPQVVLAGSGLAAPLALAAARLTGARCATYVHGLDLVAANRIYRWFWLPCVRRCDVILANSRNTARLARERGVDPARLHVVHPGADPAPVVVDDLARQFRLANGLGDRPLLLSVGRLTPRKGLADFVHDVLPRILRARPDCVLVAIGADATDALVRGMGEGSEHERIVEAARLAGVADALRMLPPCDDAALSVAYAAADVHVFPVRELPGDVEGFGMVAIEAAMHGLPTVAYAAGGVPDAVQDGVSGSLVPSGDADGFAGAVLHWLQADAGQRDACRAFGQKFAWPRFHEQVRAALVLAQGGHADGR